MRRAITNASNRRGHIVSMQICTDLRQIHSFFQRIYLVSGASPRGFSNDLMSKMEVMKASVEKVENACYNIRVRGSERADGWKMDFADDKGKRGGGDEGGDNKRRRVDQD
jgi:Translin family